VIGRALVGALSAILLVGIECRAESGIFQVQDVSRERTEIHVKKCHIVPDDLIHEPRLMILPCIGGELVKDAPQEQKQHMFLVVCLKQCGFDVLFGNLGKYIEFHSIFGDRVTWVQRNFTWRGHSYNIVAFFVESFNMVALGMNRSESYPRRNLQRWRISDVSESQSDCCTSTVLSKPKGCADYRPANLDPSALADNQTSFGDVRGVQSGIGRFFTSGDRSLHVLTLDPRRIPQPSGGFVQFIGESNQKPVEQDQQPIRNVIQDKTIVLSLSLASGFGIVGLPIFGFWLAQRGQELELSPDRKRRGRGLQRIGALIAFGSMVGIPFGWALATILSMYRDGRL